MKEPKKEIYAILSGISGATTYQMKPRVLEDLPCFLFRVANNIPRYSLDKEVEYQDIEVAIDIFAKTSKETGSLLASLVDEMIDNGYRMVFCSDIPDDNLSHIATIFNLVGY